MVLYQMILARALLFLLLENNEGNKTSSDNYRGITLSPVLSKLFEMILLNDWNLESDTLQFGFKKKSSCSHLPYGLLLSTTANQAPQ